MAESVDAWTPLRDLCAALERSSSSESDKKARKRDVKVFEEISKVTPLLGETIGESFSGPDDFLQEQTLVRVVDGLCSFCHVPAFRGREDVGFDRSNFVAVLKRAERVLPFLIILLRKIDKLIQKESSRKRHFLLGILKHVLVVCGEHAQRHLWTSENTLTATKELLAAILVVAACTDLSELLCDPPRHSPVAKSMFGLVLEELRPKLQKDVWKSNPGSMAVFEWILQEVHFPHMECLLPVVLPPCLLLIDDHEVGYKAAGVSCLHHVVREVTREEVRRHGRAEVVYDAVQQALYTREEAVLEAALPAVISLLAVVETPPSKALPPRQETRYDSILERLLQNMELESALGARRLYAHHLPSLLSDMGLSLCRHLVRLLAVVDSYLQVPDGPSEEARFAALAILSTVILQTWPRIPQHTDSILQSLLRLVHDVSNVGSTAGTETKHQLVTEAVNCARLLRNLSESRVRAQLTAVLHAPVNKHCHKFAQTVLLNPT